MTNKLSKDELLLALNDIFHGFPIPENMNEEQAYTQIKEMIKQSPPDAEVKAVIENGKIVEQKVPSPHEVAFAEKLNLLQSAKPKVIEKQPGEQSLSDVDIMKKKLEMIAEMPQEGELHDGKIMPEEQAEKQSPLDAEVKGENNE